MGAAGGDWGFGQLSGPCTAWEFAFSGSTQLKLGVIHKTLYAKPGRQEDQSGLALLAGFRPARGSVHLDFVRCDPAGTDTGTNAHINKEIVVIKNVTGKARSLTGWTLRDPSSHVYRFPATGAPRSLGDRPHRPGHRPARPAVLGPGNYVWNNDGDKATLRTNSFRLIDRCKWGDWEHSTSC